MCTNTFLYEKNSHCRNFSKYHVSTKYPLKTVLEMCKHLRESMQSFVSLFPKTFGRDDSHLLVVTSKVIYFPFFGRFPKHNGAYFV